MNVIMVASESSLNCLMKVLPVSPLPRGHIKRQVFNASIFLSSYLHFMLQRLPVGKVSLVPHLGRAKKSATVCFFIRHFTKLKGIAKDGNNFY